MINYRVIYHFTDLQDEDYSYYPGDVYPRKGLVPSEDRIEELATSKNRRGRALIAKVDDGIEEEAPATAKTEPEDDFMNPPEPPEEGAIAETDEAPAASKKPRARKKKAAKG